MARFMRSDLGRGHSRLIPPAVVDQGIVFPPIQGYLSPISDVQIAILRRGPHSKLRPPRVVTPAAAFIARPLRTPLVAVRTRAGSERERYRTLAGVRAPRFVGAGIYYAPVKTKLAPSHRRSRRAWSTRIFPYVVAAPAAAPLAPPLSVSLTPGRRGHSTARLLPPTVIDVTPQTRYLSVNLAYSSRGRPKSRLFPPQAVSYPQPFVAAPVATSLAYSLRGTPTSKLFPPQLVGEGIVFQPIAGTLFPLGYQLLPRAKSRLSPPQVTTRVEAFYGPQIALAYQSRGHTMWRLRPPTVIDLRPQAFYLSVSLTRIRPPATHSRLSPSRVTEALPYAERDLRITLAYSVRGKAKSTLRVPVVIDLRPQTVYLAVTLTYSQRGRAKSRLTPPPVVGVAAGVVYLSINLTYSRRARAKWGLAAPAVVFIPEPVLYPVSVTLAYSVRGKTDSLLRRPLVVGAVVYSGPAVTFAPQRRGAPKSELRPPVVVASPALFLPRVAVHLAYSVRVPGRTRLEPPTVVSPILARPVAVHLAYPSRGVAKSELRAPVVIDLRPQVYYLSVSLARIKPPPTFPFLRPSQVTEALPRAERDLRVYLTYSRRGAPKSELRPPVVIDLRPQTKYLSVSLAYSRRGRPRSFLRGPAPLRVFAPITVSLAYSRRGKAIYALHAPTVVGRILARPTKVELAYQSRRRGETFLRPPAVIRYEAFFGPQTTLARIKPVPVDYKLRPPTRVFPFVARPLVLTLVRITPPQRFWKLQPPTVVAGAVLHPITVWLAPSSRGVPTNFLKPPTVVTTPEPVLYPVRTTLVEIRPPKRFWKLQPPSVTRTFIPPQGDVCGFDEPGAEICGDDEADTSNNTIVGGDSTNDTVCGDDQENT